MPRQEVLPKLKGNFWKLYLQMMVEDKIDRAENSLL
jgi:hypothetical protein